MAAPLTPARYSAAAIALHWALALLLAFQLALGWRLEDLPKGAGQFAAFQLHKSVGIAILLLTLARLAVRAVKPRPAPVSGHPAAMKLAGAVHAGLYAVMVLGPLTGWLLVSTAKIRMQTMLFSTLPWPDLPVPASWHEPAEVAHGALGWLLAGLVALHVAGALYHHWRREDVIGRMLPRGLASRSALTLGAVLALAGLGGGFAAARVWPFEPVRQTPAAPLETAPAATPAASAAPGELPSPEATPSPSESASAAAESAGKWALQPGGRLGFRADYSGSPVNGSFRRWDADIVFSPEDLASSKLRVTVDLASADTADASRDEMLRSDSFFNVAAHPRAVFTSSRISARGQGRYAAAGTLTLHGKERPLTVNFELKLTGDQASASGTANLSRTGFGVGSGEWAATDTIADPVSIDFRLKAKRLR